MKLLFFWFSLLILDCIVVWVISQKLFLLFIWLSLDCFKLCSLFSFLLIWVFLTILIGFMNWLVLFWTVFHSNFSVLFPVLLNWFLDNLNYFWFQFTAFASNLIVLLLNIVFCVYSVDCLWSRIHWLLLCNSE